MNFLRKISFSTTFNYSTSTAENQGFVDNRVASEVFSYGGPPFQPNFTIGEWIKGVPATLVAIDRSGDPLYYAITPAVLPEMPETTVQDVAEVVFEVIERYYRVNTRYGCTDVTSPNFDFQANIGDNSCQPSYTNFTFGGIYQTCENTSQNYEDLCNTGSQPVMQVNPLTGDTSCPTNYTAVLLHTGQYSQPIKQTVCHRSCSWWIFGCHTYCASVPFTTVVNYNAYWCVAITEVSQSSGYLFGGYYTSSTANPFTGTKSCPRYFLPLHFGEDIQICVSNDYELGSSYAVPFAGFQSCITGNPLAASASSRQNSSSWPHACPQGYSQHLVAVDEGCEVNFCIKAGVFNQYTPLPPHLPPFRKPKSQKPNITNTLIVVGKGGNLWSKNSSGKWDKEKSNITSGMELMEVLRKMHGISNMESTTTVDSSGLSSNSTDSLSNVVVAIISVVTTFSLCTLIVVVVFAGWVISRKKKPKENHDSYITVNKGNKPETQESNI